MFNRKQIKANARFVLRRSYSTGLAVIFLTIVIYMGISMACSFIGGGLSVAINYASGAFMSSGIDDPEMLQIISFAVMEAVMLAGMVFFLLPATVGISNFFISAREQTNPVTAEYFSYGIKTCYSNKLKAMFTTYLIIWLWALLTAIPVAAGALLTYITNDENWMLLVSLCPFFAIPSYIATYRYRMVPFILANNGNITGKRARELSGVMTDGNKWKLFVMDLSFLGWLLLGMLVCYVGMIFVMPYIMAANAEAYTCLKTEAIQTKNATDETELPPLRNPAVFAQIPAVMAENTEAAEAAVDAEEAEAPADPENI